MAQRLQYILGKLYRPPTDGLRQVTSIQAHCLVETPPACKGGR